VSEGAKRLSGFQGPGGAANALNTAGGGYVSVDMLFLQFAGFTFGKSASAFATPWQGCPGNNNSFLMGGPDYITGVNNIQYTVQFGNGVSGTIGLDDPTQYNRTAILNLSVLGSCRECDRGWCQRLRRHACSRHRR
jgi:porin-like protein